MIRAIARFWAKLSYRWEQETSAARGELNAQLARRASAEKRDLVDQLNKEADDIEARIKQVAEIEEKGFWMCENGHEITTDCGCASPDGPKFAHIADCIFNDFNSELCPRKGCGKPMKLVKRSEMSGQEKYESDKERKEAEKVMADKRAQGNAEQQNADDGEKTAKYFQGQADTARALADKIRSL